MGRATLPPHPIAALVHASVAGRVLCRGLRQVKCSAAIIYILALSDSLPLTRQIPFQPLFLRSSARASRAALTNGARVARGSAVWMKACYTRVSIHHHHFPLPKMIRS